jgi:hypothetical protein
MATETVVDKEKILRGVVGASWVLYALTFIPFRAEYFIQWVFAAVTCVGLAVMLLSIFKVRFWKIAAIVVALLLLLVYIDYWVWITEMARSSKPELTSPLALGHVAEQGWTIFMHHLSNGAILGALKVVYFELLMPLVQLFAVVAFFRLRTPARPADRSSA